MAGSRRFNYAGYYTEGLASQYNSWSEITIASWMYRAAAGTWVVPWSAGGSSAAFVGLYWYNADNGIYLDIRNTTAKTASYVSTATGWHHVAATFNAGTYKIFFDGVDTNASQPASPPATLHSNMTNNGNLGKVSFSGLYTSDGNCSAWTSIFNVALTLTEVRELMQKPASPQRGRVHCWPLNGNDNSATNREQDVCGVSHATGVSMPTNSVSLLSPRVSIGGGALCL